MEEKLVSIQGKQEEDKRTRNETWKVSRPKSQGGIWELNVGLRWVTNITITCDLEMRSI